MCGILAIINKKNKKLDYRKCVNSLHVMKGRGPDWSYSKLIKKNVFFGQNVLSMTGKTNSIKQFKSKNNQLIILFNGEIYNYKDINLEYNLKLESKNLTDTAVLVNSFAKRKTSDVIKSIDGMYAIILYDNNNNSITISRDPQGEKCLYLFEDYENIILSSEINSIIHYVGKLFINKDILKSYFFSRHFITLKQSIFNKIQIIENGITKKIDLNNFKFKTIYENKIDNFISKIDYFRNKKRKFKDLAEELEYLLKKNIKTMIPQNGKFASIVSGGIDSTLISKFLKDHNTDKFFFLDHGKKDILSKKINIFKNDFKEIQKINISLDKYKKNLTESIKICCSPILSHDFVGKNILSKIVNKNGCKSLFGGDGADELFGGYHTYQKRYSNYQINNSDYSAIFDENLFKNSDAFFKFNHLLNIKWKKYLSKFDFIDNKREKSINSMMLMDTDVQLSSVGLRGSDLMTLNNSVENRSLFLRRDVVKFAINLPVKFKMDLANYNIFSTKKILKKIFSNNFSKNKILPKQGFPGWPNESARKLVNKKNLIFPDFFELKKNNVLEKIKNSKELEWKILNSEIFLNEFI